MAGKESGGRGAVLYWAAWALLALAVTAVVWAVFRAPAELGI